MNSRLTLAGVCLLAAFGLAACGGGGGGGTTASPALPTMPPPADEPTMVSLAHVATGGGGYQAPTGTHQIAAGATATSGSVTFMCAAGGDACTVMVADDGTVTATGGTVTAMNSMDYRAALTKSALTKESAISTEAAQTTDDGPGGNDATTDHTIAVARDRDGTTVTVTVDGAADTDPKFVKAADLMSSTNPGQMLTRAMDADTDGNVVTEVAIVYTDIETPKATAFGEVHELDVRVDGETATDEMPNDALNVATANLAHVKAGVFTAPAGTVGTTVLSFQQAVEDDASTTDVDESQAAAEIAGTYEGARGTYKCNAAAVCTVTVNTMGVVSAVSNDNDWIFVPADGATVDVADANYLYYGAWLKRTADSDGAITYNEVETFAGATGLPASGSIADVSGIANYEGGAAGVYVHKTFRQDGTSDATSGHFSADVSLTAYFSGGATPANKADTLEGTIDNFVLQHGEENNWSVTLQSDGDARADGVQPDADGVMDGTASGGVTGEHGSFTATFHGSTDDGGGAATVQPTAVVGEFNSVFNNGSVAGAFGARKQ